MINVGDLVNNVECKDYNTGVVVETSINMTMELQDLRESWGIDDLTSLEEELFGTSPSGARVLWEDGDMNVHYLDELEVINGKQESIHSQ